MPEIRYDPLTGDPVILAPERAGRPLAFAQGSKRARPTTDLDRGCPFCPGNEHETPAELWRRADESGDGWRVRTVTNRYPALDLQGEGVVPGGLPAEEVETERRAAAPGRHEIIIETPVHSRLYSDFSESEVAAVMDAYQDGFGRAADDERVRHVVIFRNQGPAANASIAHLHSQLVALPFVPPRVARVQERAAAYARRSGRNLLLDRVEAEAHSGGRVVASAERFLAFVPFAGRYAYEMLVAPRYAPARVDRASDDELLELGLLLRDVLAALRDALDGPDYNLILHTAPLAGEAALPATPWHVQIIPRLGATAGFELGADVHINTVAPEAAAARLREFLSA